MHWKRFEIILVGEDVDVDLLGCETKWIVDTNVS
jgi:hypothetical protein